MGEKLSVDIIARKLSPRILCLYGDLGSGKTTFIQGFAKGLGITKRILSPTFIMMRQYQITNHKSQITNLFHIDLYRIDDEKGTESLGLEEIWSDPNNIVAIEWPEKIEKILPKKRIDIRFEYLDESSRQLTISNIAI
ncbi:MAG: tRNA (adenosine(37)-N6)-threonylcarbamoyltransferase complex ATPase subunit type 1 TsaE [bacterium]|nr:tRNA (adenosine(37)-N6)-threonylcarbamoyltransferase complex ATPase subunit type 1 TsaE [bacterium]